VNKPPRLTFVTFGGAYAVLAYIAQEAVGTYGWLQPGEMLDGLGIVVEQNIGFGTGL
jgi:chromate transport protein ChrA